MYGTVAGTIPNQNHSSHLKLLSKARLFKPFHHVRYPINIIQAKLIVVKIFWFLEGFSLYNFKAKFFIFSNHIIFNEF